MIRWGYDETNGIVIGEITPIHCQVFYDNRPQKQKFSCQSEQEAEQKGKEIIAELEKEFKGFPTYLYQNRELWEIRIYK